ncbi:MULTISPECIES: NYN domain-containing protein [unclassified Leptolyngbya]|uniref:NYN domain-containing protein n=1 Tax=unclassified Leptolyngbya TaxID=2650499 RepID=UPI001682FC88|nr:MULTISPECIES: NYN domain-containing protein [unclassified Leptolyngbya]MBD1912260.1 NYN domain-containing protein [Leptolyngbya sp. FACHB-8]MBD2155151.1 NYN domain-containing protein [Leptolyngbya sp. FACHB-16]
MSTDTRNTLDIASQLAHRVCQAIATQYQQNPNWLAEGIRQNDWQNPTNQSKLFQKLATTLGEVPDDQKVLKCQKLLKLFFDTTFLSTQEYQLLVSDLEILDQGTTVAELENRGISLLLLDAENLQLSAEQENFLASLCTYPLQVKIAFADWKKLGKHDEELHQRHYDLIHVPKGKDMADGKMITVGTSLKEHYKNVQEVLVCSSDKVMTSLYIKLQQQGLIAYQIQKQSDGTLSILNSRTGDTCIYPTAMLPSLEDAIMHLQHIVWEEQQKTSQTFIQLAVVSKRFQERIGFRISEIIGTYLPGRSVKELLVSYSNLFAIHQVPGESGLYVSLFTLPDSEQVKQYQARQEAKQQLSETRKSAITITSNSVQKAQLNLKSAEELEAAIVSIIEAIEANKPSEFITISIVGSQFSQKYKCPITTALKQLNINKKYPAFLQSCKKLIVQQNGNIWMVKLRSSKNKG